MEKGRGGKINEEQKKIKAIGESYLTDLLIKKVSSGKVSPALSKISSMTQYAYLKKSGICCSFYTTDIPSSAYKISTDISGVLRSVLWIKHLCAQTEASSFCATVVAEGRVILITIFFTLSGSFSNSASTSIPEGSRFVLSQ